MASKVKLTRGREFNFKTSESKQSKYPWDEWLSGDLLLIEQSAGEKDDKGAVVTVTDKKDYEVDNDAMPPKLKVAARKRYKVVQVSRYDQDGEKLKNAFIIKARDMTAEERIDEDRRRAEEKEEARAKRAADGHSTNGTHDEGDEAE